MADELFNFRIDGAEELTFALARTPGEIQQSVTGPACARAARVIAKDLKKLIPVVTGDLTASVRVVRLRDRTKQGVIPGGKAIVAYGDYTAWYSHIVELGSVKRPAKHYLKKATQMRREAQHEAFVRGAARELELAVKRAQEASYRR